MSKRYHATKKFAKIQALHDAGAPAKEIRKMSDSWTKRGANTPLWNPKHAKPSACVITQGGAV